MHKISRLLRSLLSHSHVTLMLCDIHNIFTTQCTMLQDKTNMHFDQAHQHNLLL